MIPIPTIKKYQLASSFHLPSNFKNRLSTHQGILTLQFRKIAARPNSITSVIMLLPFVNSIPPTAGRSAKANGAECHALPPSSPPLAFGSSKSSVLDWKLRLASLKL
jgi:hypothetical protein